MKIGMKLGVAFAALCVIIVVLIYLGINTASTLNESVQLLANDRFPKTVWANNIIDAVNEGARALRNALLTNDPKERDAQIERAKATTPKVKPYFDSLFATIKSEKGIQILNELKSIREQYIKDRSMLIDLIEADNKQDAMYLLFGDFRKSQNDYLNKIIELIDYQGQLFRQSAEEAESTYNSQFNLLLILGLVALVLAVVLAVVVTRGITKPINTGVNVADQISKGNTNVNVEITTKDETAMLLNSMKSMALTIQSIISEINTAVKMATEGKLDYRANASKYQGDYKELMVAFNNALDALIKPINVTAEYVDRISKGDMPPKITDEYKGDFNEIKNNLNTCIDAINALIADANFLSKAAVEGKLDTRADASKHQGDFRRIIQGVNDTLDAVIGPLNVAAEYIDRIAKGDIPPKITQEYKGDFNEIKNNLNTAIDAINLLVTDSKMLAQSAAEGKLSVRADGTKHQGDFRVIVDGINKTLDNVIEPINEASEVLGILASGDLRARVKGDYKGDLAKLKSDINQLAESLSALINEVNNTVEQVASAATQISATSDSLAAASQEQSAQTDDVASAVEEMSRTITENAMGATRTAEVAQKNGELANQGGAVVQQTVQKMKDIAKVVGDSALTIQKLGESSKQIGEIIAVIDDIADQTNLLALNAAIEAARAGEQGRGFAVVADEVRKLAERTTDATKQIANMIRGIQKETDMAVEAMNQGNQEVQKGIDLADRAGQALRDILNSTKEVLEMINQIAAASEEQSATSEEISKNVVSISKVIAESSRRVEDVAHASDDMAKLTERLRNLMMQFKVGGGDMHFGNVGYEARTIGGGASKRQLASGSAWD